MKKRMLSVALVLALLLTMLPTAALPAYATNGIMQGSGTPADPYIIMDESDLKAITNDMAASYVLGTDIAPGSWTAVISGSTFSGSLDGNGYTITLPAGATNALFGGNMTGTISNLRVYAPELTLNNTHAGVIVSSTQDGRGIGGSVVNCAVIGNIKINARNASLFAGGFAGQMTTEDAKIENCYSAVTIENIGTGGSSAFNTGAFTGQVYPDKGSLVNCRYDSTLTEKAVGYDQNETPLSATGMATADLKAAASAINATVPEGMPKWKNAEEGDAIGYPLFAEHKRLLEGKVNISGTAKVGQTLTAEDDFATEAARTYSWYRMSKGADSETIEGAESKTYVPTAADAGYKLGVKVTVDGLMGACFADMDKAVEAAVKVKLTFSGMPEGAVITVRNDKGYIEKLTGAETEIGDGMTYTWFAAKDGYATKTGTVTAAGTDINVDATLTAKTPAAGFSSEEEYNMLRYNLSNLSAFPTSVDEAVLKWATCCGLYPSGVGSNEVTNAVFADGKMFILSGEGGKMSLTKIDPESGEILDKKALKSGNGFFYFLTTGDDLIFVRENGCMEAFDTDMNLVWQVENTSVASGEQRPNQSIFIPASYGAPVLYSDGYIYFGTAQARAKKGDHIGFYCLSAADGSLVWFNETEIFGSQTGSYAGHYWAGAAAVGDWLVYGSDGGRVYSVNKYTGEIVSRLDAGEGIYTSDLYKSSFVRSSIAYENGKIYFTSTDDYIHMADIDLATGVISGHKYNTINEKAGSGGNSFMGGGTTGTPVVYNGRVYIGSSANFSVFDATTLEKIYMTPHTNKVLRDLRLVADEENDCVYLFTSCYQRPGSIVMFKDAAGQTESSGYSDFSAITSDYDQYCASMPIIGPDGTIYTTNDLGYLMAIAKPEVYLTKMIPSAGDLKNEFSSYDLNPEIVVPVGTESIAVELAATDGATISVGGASFTSGTYTVTLTDGKAEEEIVVRKGSKTLVYNLSVREISTSTVLNVITTTLNSPTSGTKVIKLLDGTDDVYMVTGAKPSIVRLWLGVDDALTTMSTPEVRSGAIRVTDVTTNNTYNGKKYPVRFYGGATFPATIAVKLTAEDGTEKTYYLILTEDTTYDGTTPYLLDMSISKTELTLKGEDASETLTASLRYLGTAPETENEITWNSSDESVASVDENGKVTATGNGTAVITATSGSFAVTCAVTAEKHAVGGKKTSTLLYDEYTCTNQGCGETFRIYKNTVFKAVEADSSVKAFAASGTNYPWVYKGGRLESANAEVDKSESELNFTFTLSDSAVVSFDYGVSSEEDCDTFDTVLTKDKTEKELFSISGEQNESFKTVLEAGTYTLSFKYTKDAGVAEGSDLAWIRNLKITKADVAYISFADNTGSFAKGADDAQTVINKTPVYVFDLDNDGKLTVEEAFKALHKDYCQTGAEGYLSNGGYISRFWGEDTYNLSYTVNNRAALSTADEIVSGDSIYAFMYRNTTDYSDIYAYFDPDTANAKTNEKTSFTVKGLAVMSGAEIAPVGATVKVYDANGEEIDSLATTTGASGKFDVKFPAAGTYKISVSGSTTYTATDWEGNPKEYKDAPITPAECTVTVKDNSGGGESGGKDTIKVSFRLIGATQSKNGVDIAEGIDDSEYVTWIKTSKYNLDAGSTVYDLFTKVLDKKNLDYVITGGNWVESITAPEAAGGYTLAQYDNGAYSGWMYYVNGIHVQETLDKQVLKNNDVVIWHYINDYRYEDSQWYGGSEGSKEYWDRWLKAPDTEPAGDNGAGGSGSVTDPTGTEITTGEDTTSVFNDVPANAWYKQAAERLAAMGLVKGTADKIFSPDADVSRGMIVTILGRLYEKGNKLNSGEQKDIFKDVASGSYYNEYVLWGQENNIVKGITDDMFAPDADVTREQMAVFLYRYAKLIGYNTEGRADLSAYKDADKVSDYAKEAMSWAVNEGILQGTGDSNLDPQSTATRAQVVVLLSRFIDKTTPAAADDKAASEKADSKTSK